ncbi:MULTISPECIES: hypothetical protein [unclassified Pseudonocardia]|uniref:hypothetical protein n=1 Tax=unclassified Pseudonocardia TaxID=2619320 RepID=UPI0007610801|nr:MULTISPECIES: hypothetical protein [unclassified Pseudonocardia]
MTAVPTQHTDAPAGIPVWHGVDEVPAGSGPCVVALGVFDGLHRGHRRIVATARAVARRRGLPVLLVTFDPHPARVLGTGRDTAALSTLGHRAELAADAGADAVCVLRFTRELAARTPQEFAREVLVAGLRAAAVVVGADFTFGARGAGTVGTLRELGRELGFTAHGVDLLQDAGTTCSSTHARRCLRAGDLAGAERALGRPHRVHGQRRSDRVVLEPDTALPPPGRYRALVGDRPATVEIDLRGGLRLLGAVTTGRDGTVAVTFPGAGTAAR